VAEYGVTSGHFDHTPMFVAAGAGCHPPLQAVSTIMPGNTSRCACRGSWPGPNIDLVEQIKKVVQSGDRCGAHHAGDREKAIRQGKLDFVAMGRALEADPDLPTSWLEQREDIRPCITAITA